MGDIWTCKIGKTDIPREDWNYHPGADYPMRQAITKAYKEITGEEKPEFIFSGWGGELTASERAAVEDRLPTKQEDLARASKLEKEAQNLRTYWENR